jgi:N-acetylneuraminic acid mutarotase
MQQQRSLRFAVAFLLAVPAGCGREDKPGQPAAPATSGAGGSRASGGASGQAGSGGEPGTGGAAAPATDAAAAETPAEPAAMDGSAEASAPSVDAGSAASDVAPPPGAPAPGEYGTRAPLLERNSEFALAALDGKIYVLGGYPSSPAETRPTLQIYDPATNTWKLGAPAPAPVHHPMIAGVNGKLYSLGGQPNTRVVQEYDPIANTWRPRQPMPTERGGGATAVMGTKIYVVGARPPVTPEAANAFEVYDVSTDRWDTLPPLPNRFPLRNHLAAAAIGGKVYVAGGRYNECCVNAPMTASLDVFDPASETWTPKANMLRPRGGVAGVAVGGCFHVYGGEGSGIGEPNGVFPDHDVYNPITDKWTALKKLPVPFHGVTGGAVVDGVIYMPGGGIRSGGSSGTLMHQTYRPDMRCE